jgi:hypothetical protein
MSKPLLSVALALASAPIWAANAPPALPESIAACALVQDAVERATCYDREVAALRNTPNPPVVVTPPATPASAPKTAAETKPPATTPSTAPPKFGEESVRKDRRQNEDAAADLLQAKITRLRQPLRGYYLINLDNGQIWKQKDAKAYFKLLVGEAISIRRGTLGSYRLWPDRDGSINWVYVTRVR